MSGPNPLIWAFAAVTLVGFLGLGLWASRRTRDSRDFFIAGQRLGLWITGLAAMAASFSGFVFLGGPGLTYRMGTVSLLIVLPVSVTSALLCWSVGERLRALAGVREIFTVPEAVAARFPGRAPAALAALAVLVGTVAYLGAQLLALGILVETVLGTRALVAAWGLPEGASLPLALGLGLAVVLAYSVAGGMVAGVVTDGLQGVLMMGAAVAVGAWAVGSAGGPGAMVEAIAGSELFGRAFLDPLSAPGAAPGGAAGAPALLGLGFFFVFTVGILGQPQVVHKFFMVEDPRSLRWLPLVLAVGQSLCLLIWIGVGLAVPALVARGRLDPLVRPDDAAPVFLLQVAPVLLAGVVFAGVLAAIMSTADSLVNIGAASLVRDLPRALGRRIEARRELAWGRWASVAVALGAAAVALLYGDLIALLGTFAFGTFGAALAPVLAVGLAWRRVTGTAAAASIAVGFSVNLALELLPRQELLPVPELAPGALPSAVALAASFAVLFLVTAVTRPDPPLEPEVEAVLAASE